MECKLSFEDKVAVLEIPKSKLKDSGKYVCTAANEAGSSSCEALTFSGTKPLKVRWLKAGKELTSGQRYKVQSKDTSSVLKIIKTQKSDGGEYVFEVSNDVGQSSCDATLTILVQFSVLFSGTPPLTTKWFKSSKEILSSADWSVIKDNTSSTLELFFAKTTDSGDYVCQIQNDVGSASCQATLFVKGY
uniref:Ig-like domain-containing protein n=1 Tax=Astatotilapia calliptera TaxID=8154 RepID=A0A3P8NZX1_ASTCA